MSVKKVIFPVDLAGSSHRIASRVRSVVESLDAELHLVLAVDIFKGYDTFFIPHRSLDLMEREDRALAERDLEEFAEKYFQDVPRVKRVVLHGNPVEQIRDYIASQDADMVIVAAYHLPFFERTLFGDMAGKIVKTSPIPVTVINPFELEGSQTSAPSAEPLLVEGLPGA